MPNGMIDDPRQNQNEKRYGICKSDVTGNRYWYKKQGDHHESRFWTQGYPIVINAIHPNEVATIIPHPAGICQRPAANHGWARSWGQSVAYWL